MVSQISAAGLSLPRTAGAHAIFILKRIEEEKYGNSVINRMLGSLIQGNPEQASWSKSEYGGWQLLAWPFPSSCQQFGWVSEGKDLTACPFVLEK